MNVCVEILFDSPDEDAWNVMRSLGEHVTNDRGSVRVFVPEGTENWLAVEFAMPAEAQYKALEKVECAVRLCAWRRLDSAISFPKSEAERARARRKAERRRARRDALLPKRFSGELRVEEVERIVEAAV